MTNAPEHAELDPRIAVSLSRKDSDTYWRIGGIAFAISLLIVANWLEPNDLRALFRKFLSAEQTLPSKSTGNATRQELAAIQDAIEIASGKDNPTCAAIAKAYSQTYERLSSDYELLVRQGDTQMIANESAIIHQTLGTVAANARDAGCL